MYELDQLAILRNHNMTDITMDCMNAHSSNTYILFTPIVLCMTRCALLSTKFNLGNQIALMECCQITLKTAQ